VHAPRGRERRRRAGATDQVGLPDIVGLRDPGHAAALARDGYVRVGPLLDAASCEQLRSVFDEAMRRLGRPLGDEWFPTILLPDADVRGFIDDEVRSVVLPRLVDVFDLDQLDTVRIDYSVKPPGPGGLLGPHQDFSIVDERTATSLYIWIPLVDTGPDNGTLHVLPGSHRFTNRIRSRYVPAMFDPVLTEVERRSVPLDCRAGDLVVMVSGVVHYSPPNTTDDLRLAVHGIFKPAAAPLLYYYADEETPDGMVEVYPVEIDDYIELTLSGRPGAEHPMLGYRDRPPMLMDPDRFAEGMRSVSDVG